MTQALFEGLTLKEIHEDAIRNIKSIRVAQDLYDDLSSNPEDWQIAISAELAVKPDYSQPNIIERPFEETRYFHAMAFPFTLWMTSRYSSGEFGVWYGADSLKTTVYETVHHWRRFLEAAEGFTQYDRSVIGERRVYRVHCDAALLNFIPQIARFPLLIDPEDYHFTQEVGRRVHHEGQPGILTRSARCEGKVYAIFRKEVLSHPRNYCDLTYELDSRSGRVTIRRQSGTVLMVIDA